ncbi:MAG: glycyl-radical enzyme activating protein [Spirochaetes bacterium]|nr:glycyl-radical enzyme activating protein [Spirochaetota bacterium]
MEPKAAPSLQERGIVFDVQQFSLHDGPGIRTTIFFKGCPLRCRWCQNPESHRYSMELSYSRDRCIRCNECVRVCPAGAVRDDECRFDMSRCTLCGSCAEACPARAVRVVGMEYSPEALMAEAGRDRDFFSGSGGGVTLSGGEPMGQHRFLAAFCPMLKAQGIHILLETCGHFEWSAMEGLLPFLDLVYFDLKHADDGAHRKWTGVGNGLILENLGRLSASGVPVQPRMPVIPGVNDGGENIAATAALLRGYGQGVIHLLPYHNLGEGKRRQLDSPSEYIALEPMQEGAMERVKNLFVEEGLDVVLYR